MASVFWGIGVCEGMGLGKDSGASAGMNSRGACFLSTAGLVSVDVNLGEYNTTCSCHYT